MPLIQLKVIEGRSGFMDVACRTVDQATIPFAIGGNPF
jgi:hypothetical protein